MYHDDVQDKFECRYNIFSNKTGNQYDNQGNMIKIDYSLE